MMWYVTCACGNLVMVDRRHDFGVLPCPECVHKEATQRFKVMEVVSNVDTLNFMAAQYPGLLLDAISKTENGRELIKIWSD